ncbi:hypothetical protein BDV12DRAFT_193178 [Aspergillus spectabilis]
MEGPQIFSPQFAWLRRLEPGTRSDFSWANTLIQRQGTALLRAASFSSWDIVSDLAEAGAKANTAAVKSSVDTALGTTPSRITVLSYAVTHGAWDQMKRLLDIGADPNSVSLSGNPILAVAASSKCWNTVRLLVGKGADVNAEYRVERKALDYVTTSLFI